MNIIINFLLGMFPEVLFMTFFLIYTKNLKEKRILLFLLICINYILCIIINKYKLLYYVSFIILIYLILKLLYKKKTQIIDIFIINFAFAYISFTSFICFLFVKEDLSNYYLLAIIHKVILLLLFIFCKHFNKIYKKYYSLWNRNDNIKRHIKSITLRNISLIILNLCVSLFNLIMIYLSQQI